MNENMNGNMPTVATPPRKKKKWPKRVVVIALIVFLLVTPAGCAVYFTMKPTNSLTIPWSVGFTSGVRTGPGAESGQEGDKQILYGTPDESLKANGWYDDCEFVSEPLAVEETDDSIAVLYFCDIGYYGKGELEFNVVRMEKKEGRYANPPKSGAYAFTDTNMADNGKYIYETIEAKTAYYLFNRLTDNYPEPAQGFQYYGVSTDPNIGNLSILGEHPTGIIDYTYEGTTYYFWYYDGLDIVGYLASRDDFDFGGFTAAQLIEVLDIKMEG